MLSKPAEKLIERIRALRYSFLLLHLVLIAASIWIGFLLTKAIREKYLFYQPLASLLIICTLASILLMHALFRFNTFSVDRILRILDEKYRLLDRLTTYHQLRQTDHPFLPAFIGEINPKLESVSPVLLITKISQSALAVACLLVLFASLVFLPYLPESQTIANQKRQKARVNAEAKQLQKEVFRLKQEKKIETEKVLKEFERTARDLQKPEVKNEDALRKLNDLQMKLEAQAKQLNDEKRKQLAEKLNGLAAEGQTSQTEKEALQEMADQVKSGEGGEDPAQRAERLAEDQKSTPELRKELHEALENYRKEQKQTTQQMAEIQNALENAKKGISSGAHKFTANSRISERNAETKKSGVNDGPGSTNQDVGPQNFDTKKSGKSEYVEDRTKLPYEQLYKGERQKAGSDPLFLKGQWEKQGEQKYVEIRNFGLNKKSSAGQDHVSSINQDLDETALREEKVPASYQKIVKKYFESIKQ